jgi:hypothetical protein
MRQTLLVAGLAAAALAPACLIVTMGHPAALRSESVIIVWDAERSIQHFVRQPGFETETDRLGFVVPTPTRPEVASVDSKVFVAVGRWAREMKERAQRGMEVAKAAGVRVVESKRVGDWEATVLQASDGAALTDWLKANGFVSRPSVAEWAQGYAARGWYFTAFRYVLEPGRAAGPASGVRLSFATPAPFYPYRRPEPGEKGGELHLAFFSTGLAAAKPLDGPGTAAAQTAWSAQTMTQGWIEETEAAELAKMLRLRRNDLPRDVYMTYFTRHGEPKGFAEDLEFEVGPAPRPGPEALVPLVAGLALVGGAWALGRRRPRARS